MHYFLAYGIHIEYTHVNQVIYIQQKIKYPAESGMENTAYIVVVSI